jgi:mRNA-degrading endonuclease toxin of MazEF toxin-antitoxin module
MTRGELWWADFGFPFGSEPGFRSPILIVQDDAFNESEINTIDFEEACAREQGEDSTCVAVIVPSLTFIADLSAWFS